MLVFALRRMVGRAALFGVADDEPGVWLAGEALILMIVS